MSLTLPRCELSVERQQRRQVYCLQVADAHLASSVAAAEKLWQMIEGDEVVAVDCDYPRQRGSGERQPVVTSSPPSKKLRQSSCVALRPSRRHGLRPLPTCQSNSHHIIMKTNAPPVDINSFMSYFPSLDGVTGLQHSH